MVRATEGEMKKLTGGKYLPGHDATSYGNFADQTDSELDLMALPGLLSTTGTNEVALANRTAVDMVLHSVWAQAGGVLSRVPEPGNLNKPSYYDHVQKQVTRLLGGTTHGPVAAVDTVGVGE